MQENIIWSLRKEEELHSKQIDELKNEQRHNNECLVDCELQINSLMKDIKNEKETINQEKLRHQQIQSE